MKPALNHARRASTATCKGSSDVYPVPPNSIKRQSRVSFSSNDAINEFNARHPPSASYSHPQSPAQTAALGATGSLGAKNGQSPATHVVPKRQNQAHQVHHQAHQANKAHKPTSAVLAPPKPKARPPPPSPRPLTSRLCCWTLALLPSITGTWRMTARPGTLSIQTRPTFPSRSTGPTRQ